MPAPLSPDELESLHGDQRHGDDPYSEVLANSTLGDENSPHCMYFVYVGLDRYNAEDIRHYYHDNGRDPILYNDASALVKKLADNASLRDHLPPQCGVGFKNMIWRRKSYLAFVVDHLVYELWPNQAIEFNDKDGGLPNHSFYDGKNFSIDVKRPDGSTVRRTAFLCVNHMTDSTGNPLQGNEYFSFALLLKAGTLPEPLKYDPGGTNDGPAVGPP